MEDPYLQVNHMPTKLNLSKNQCERMLRKYEIAAYKQIVSVFRAQGELTKDRKKLLHDIQSVLSISLDYHKTIVRKAINDPVLSTIAYVLSGPNTSIEWSIEGRRLIPIIPRATPQVAYTAVASNLAEKYCRLNLNKLVKRRKEPPVEVKYAGSESEVTESEDETEGLRYIPELLIPSEINKNIGPYTVLPMSEKKVEKASAQMNKKVSSPINIKSNPPRGSAKRKRKHSPTPDCSLELPQPLSSSLNNQHLLSNSYSNLQLPGPPYKNTSNVNMNISSSKNVSFSVSKPLAPTNTNVPAVPLPLKPPLSKIIKVSNNTDIEKTNLSAVSTIEKESILSSNNQIDQKIDTQKEVSNKPSALISNVPVWSEPTTKILQTKPENAIRTNGKHAIEASTAPNMLVLPSSQMLSFVSRPLPSQNTLIKSTPRVVTVNTVIPRNSLKNTSSFNPQQKVFKVSPPQPNVVPSINVSKNNVIVVHKTNSIKTLNVPSFHDTSKTIAKPVTQTIQPLVKNATINGGNVHTKFPGMFLLKPQSAKIIQTPTTASFNPSCSITEVAARTTPSSVIYVEPNFGTKKTSTIRSTMSVTQAIDASIVCPRSESDSQSRMYTPRHILPNKQFFMKENHIMNEKKDSSKVKNSSGTKDNTTLISSHDILSLETKSDQSFKSNPTIIRKPSIISASSLKDTSPLKRSVAKDDGPPPKKLATAKLINSLSCRDAMQESVQSIKVQKETPSIVISEVDGAIVKTFEPEGIVLAKADDQSEPETQNLMVSGVETDITSRSLDETLSDTEVHDDSTLKEIDSSDLAKENSLDNSETRSEKEEASDSSEENIDVPPVKYNSDCLKNACKINMNEENSESKKDNLSDTDSQEHCSTKESDVASDISEKSEVSKKNDFVESDKTSSEGDKTSSEELSDEGLSSLVEKAVEVLRDGDKEQARSLLMKAGLELCETQQDYDPFAISSGNAEQSDLPQDMNILPKSDDSDSKNSHSTTNSDEHENSPDKMDESLSMDNEKS